MFSDKYLFNLINKAPDIWSDASVQLKLIIKPYKTINYFVDSCKNGQPKVAEWLYGYMD